MKNTIETPKQGRGQLTQRVIDKSKELLDYEISVRELRLMPYLQNTMMDSQKINFAQLNGEEIAIIRKWSENGFVGIEDYKLSMTKEFWDIINQILYLAYVDLND